MALWTTSPDTKNKNKKNEKNKNQNKKQGQTKQQKNPKPQTKSFSVTSQNFLCFCFVQKEHFLTTWPKTHAPSKHYKIWGFQRTKNSYASRNGHFWTQKTQIQKFQLSLFLSFFLLFSTTKTQKCSETPIFRVF